MPVELLVMHYYLIQQILFKKNPPTHTNTLSLSHTDACAHTELHMYACACTHTLATLVKIDFSHRHKAIMGQVSPYNVS